jgi:hypothetical protein
MVILAVGVVITLLCATAFVAATKHGNALREKKSAQEIALLSPPESVDFLIFPGTFGPAVPRLIVIVAVPIILAVCLVVLIVIGD